MSPVSLSSFIQMCSHYFSRPIVTRFTMVDVTASSLAEGPILGLLFCYGILFFMTVTFLVTSSLSLTAARDTTCLFLWSEKKTEWHVCIACRSLSSLCTWYDDHSMKTLVVVLVVDFAFCCVRQHLLHSSLLLHWRLDFYLDLENLPGTTLM